MATVKLLDPMEAVRRCQKEGRLISDELAQE
jgi:hypothetical protein